MLILIPGTALLTPGVGGSADPLATARSEITHLIDGVLSGESARVAVVAGPALLPASGGNADERRAGVPHPVHEPCAWTEPQRNAGLGLGALGIPERHWPTVGLRDGRLVAETVDAGADSGICAACQVAHGVALVLLAMAQYRGEVDLIPAAQAAHAPQAGQGAQRAQGTQGTQAAPTEGYELLLVIGDFDAEDPAFTTQRAQLHQWIEGLVPFGYGQPETHRLSRSANASDSEAETSTSGAERSPRYEVTIWRAA